jgi:hypothetical protein
MLYILTCAVMKRKHPRMHCPRTCYIQCAGRHTISHIAQISHRMSSMYFGPLKKVLKGSQFGSDEDCKAAVMQWFQQHPGEFFAEGADASVECLSHCPSGQCVTSSVPFPRTVLEQHHSNKPHSNLHYAFHFCRLHHIHS